MKMRVDYLQLGLGKKHSHNTIHSKECFVMQTELCFLRKKFSQWMSLNILTSISNCRHNRKIFDFNMVQTDSAYQAKFITDSVHGFVRHGTHAICQVKIHFRSIHRYLLSNEPTINSQCLLAKLHSFYNATSN